MTEKKTAAEKYPPHGHGCCIDRKYGKGCSDESCMELPEGKTCGDCVHIGRCIAFGFTRERERTYCDFFPRRFHEAPQPEPAPEGADA